MLILPALFFSLNFKNLELNPLMQLKELKTSNVVYDYFISDANFLYKLSDGFRCAFLAAHMFIPVARRTLKLKHQT